MYPVFVLEKKNQFQLYQAYYTNVGLWNTDVQTLD